MLLTCQLGQMCSLASTRHHPSFYKEYLLASPINHPFAACCKDELFSLNLVINLTQISRALDVHTLNKNVDKEC